MIEYYQIGGQLYANVRRFLVPRSFWYIVWGESEIRFWPITPGVPDDIQ